MKNRLYILLLALLQVLLWACTPKADVVDVSRRAKADEFNKASFQNRYKDPAYGIAMADSALLYIHDSLPAYGDGMLRAYNNRAFCSFMLSDYASVDESLRMVLDGSIAVGAANKEIEVMIAHLLQARMLQRKSDIAGSYQILYDIDKSHVLERERTNYLYNLAKTEYYITSLTLNYHYRNGSQFDGRLLLQEIEEERPSLKVDYAQDMSLNYAMAHSYYKLCESVVDSVSRRQMLEHAVYLIRDNVELMQDDPEVYCTFHMADALQMLAFIYSDPDLGPLAVEILVPGYCSDSVLIDGYYGPLQTDSIALFFAGELFSSSYQMFWWLDDPYQRLGASVATAGFALSVGDTLWAHQCYRRVLQDSTMRHHFASKFEALLYEGLINSGYPGTLQDYQHWFNEEIDMLNYITQKQKADFILQQQLSRSQSRSQGYAIFGICVSVLASALVVVLVLLRRKARALAEEKRQLQEAKRKDVERIATVETCLSVLRHDITPFVSYLQNKKLPESLRQEVLDRLVHTFDNIKSWTTLSIPVGLRFRSGNVAVGEIFDEVQHHVVNLHSDQVRLTFNPSSLKLWGDKLLLTILLRNLVTNALQHTASGSVEVDASPWQEDGRFALLTVTDTGCGMSEEEVENMFRTDKKIRPSAGNEQGHGFGLILARYIIKLHDDNTLRGCRIWAESEPGKGSRLCFLVAKAIGNHE